MNLEEILHQHRIWLETNSKKGKRADLSGAKLSGANLSEAKLRRANLSGANLRRANLIEAKLNGADLRHADLSGADLRHAYLSNADLSNAYLRHAYLSNADLSNAYLSNARLWGTIGDRKRIKNISVFPEFAICYFREKEESEEIIVQIGCKRFSFEKWLGFDNDEIEAMNSKARMFNTKARQYIIDTIKQFPPE